MCRQPSPRHSPPSPPQPSGDTNLSQVRTGHPLVGDPFYGGDPRLAARLGLGRQWLHAAELEFDHPVTGLPVRLASEPPPDLAAALEILRHP
jgi:hypothetical protein